MTTTLRPLSSYAGNLSFNERNQLLKSLAGSAGLRLPTTILPEGHALWDVGVQAQRRLAAEVKALPDLRDALVAMRTRIEQENPLDFKAVPVQTMRMDPRTGRLHGKDKDASSAIGYTNSGFSQTAQFLKPNAIRSGFAENMLALPEGLRASVFNHWANSSTRTDPLAVRTIVEPSSGKRVIRALTSDRHSLETGDDRMIIDAIEARDVLMKGAKARITREHDRSEFEVIWPGMNRQLVVGDMALCGVRVKNSETKAGALKVEAFILRVLCANFTTAESVDLDGEELSLRHMGDLTLKLPRLFEKALSRIEPFVTAFSDAYQVHLPHTRGETLAQVGKAYKLGENVLQLAAEKWDADGIKSAGDTLAGLINALTRASQEQDIETAGVIEKIAGRMAVTQLVTPKV